MEEETRNLMASMVAHEANRLYCATLGDHSQKRWEEAPAWQRESALNGVLSIAAGNDSARESHENWLQHKIANGWVYGKEKNEEKKTHPCVVEYDDLPEDQKFKDHLFTAVVKAVLKA